MAFHTDGPRRLLTTLLTEGLMNFESLAFSTGMPIGDCETLSQSLSQQGLVTIMPFGLRGTKKNAVVLLTALGKEEAAKNRSPVKQTQP